MLRGTSLGEEYTIPQTLAIKMVDFLADHLKLNNQIIIDIYYLLAVFS